jgi:hypothetical protein
MESKHEIFDSPWEYFTVAWWGVSKPSDEELLDRKQADKSEIEKKYSKEIESLTTNKKKQYETKEFEQFVENWKHDEDQRRETIETKAHSLLGHTGITVTLLLGSLSIGATQASGWSIWIKIVAWLFFIASSFQFIVAGLLARNSVLTRGFSNDSPEDLLDPKTNKTNILVSRLYQADYNSFLNDAKGSYLKFAHWYFKCGLMILFIGVLTLPPLVFFFTPQQRESNRCDKIVVVKCDSTSSIKNYIQDQKIDSLNVKVNQLQSFCDSLKKVSPRRVAGFRKP